MARVDERMEDLIGADRWERLGRLGRWATRSYVVIIVLGIAVGLQVAPLASEVAPRPAQGQVAVVSLQGGIDGGNAASVVARLKRAREDPRIDAVVLRINSGGGGASASEAIYMAVKRTAEEMPVVASVNAIAASGAYYSAAPADLIYVKPSSFIGSVGVFFVAPTSLAPLDILITTGPNKLNGADRREWMYKIEADRRAFVGAVFQHRGDELTISREELSYAKLYTGSEAVRNGIADDIGGLEDAIKRAAAMADLSNYRVRSLDYGGTVTYVTQTAYVASSTDDKELISPAYFVRNPTNVALPNPLMLPPSVIRAGVEDELRSANVSVTTGVNTSDVDVSAAE